MTKEEMNDFLNACVKLFCLECGRPVICSGKGRPRVFCSDRCRWAYDKRRRRKRMKEVKLNKNSRIERVTKEYRGFVKNLGDQSRGEEL